MDITELEHAVITRLLQDPHLHPLKRDIDFAEINVSSREFTGAGFITTFEPAEALRPFAEGITLRWGKVGARLNASEIETGYLVYVDDGYLTGIEGYTYGDDWPECISSIELYELQLGAELGANE